MTAARRKKLLTQVAEIEIRRADVMRRWVRGATDREIAVALGVSKGTITSDRAAVLEATRAEAAQDAAVYRARELAKLAEEERVLWSHYETTAPDLAAFTRLHAIHERRAKLLGLDAPVQTEVAARVEWAPGVPEQRPATEAEWVDLAERERVRLLQRPQTPDDGLQ